MGPRARKVAADLVHNKARSALVILSIATGVFAVGMVAGSYKTLLDSMEKGYRSSAPAHATLYLREPFDADLADTVRNFRGVKEAQSRRSAELRAMKTEDEGRSISLISVPDFRDIRLGKVKRLSGRWPPAQDEILMEVSSFEAYGAEIGGKIVVETPMKKRRTLTITGIVRDYSAPSASFTGRLTGYVNFDTIDALGEDPRPDQLLVTLEGEELTRKDVQDSIRGVRNRLEGSGLSVGWTRVPPPGEHPMTDPINTLLVILFALGVLVLFLSGFLLVNTISALLTQQIRQIGVMKAVGATTGQIATMYLALVVIFSTLSALIAVPLGMAAARAATGYVARLMNLELEPFDVPWPVLAGQVVLGFVVPFVAAFPPILKAARITVREAVAFYGVGAPSFGTSFIDRFVARIRFLTRPALLSLANTFRRKGRLLLTLCTLSTGGAIFMGVFSVRSAMLDTLEDALAYWNYDVEAEFVRPYRRDRLLQEVMSIPGVVRAETWGFAAAQLVEDWTGRNENRVFLIAPPADTDMLRPTIIEGRWLQPGDEAAAVINTEVLKHSPGIKVGDVIRLRLGLRKTEWKVVGIVRGVLAGPFVYANQPWYAYVSGEGSRASSVQMITQVRTAEFQRDVAKKLEDRFKAAGIQVSSVTAADEWKGRAVRQFEVIVSFLLVMATLMAFVGALALMGTMGINVIERTREIGIIRAVGAGTGSVLGIFILEGICIGGISWVVGILLSVPVATVLGRQVGQMFTRAPLDFSFSMPGVVIWLLIILLLSAAASILPALKAARLSVREVLVAE